MLTISRTPRRFSLASTLALGALSLGAWLAPAAAAQEAKKEGAAVVPLNKVVMFTSGVGYFEHRGEIDGNAQLDLKFNVDNINDLLKSMILEDRGGGQISTVTFASRDPITKTLATFPINLTDNPTLSGILNQVRGEKVQIDAPTVITGVLLGVEKRKKEVGKDHETVEVEYLNLLTEGGLRSVPMDGISRIKLLNEELDAEFHKALQVLALGHNTDKKLVTLDFLGKGKRPVRIGYVQQTPVWKTSYRLVLDGKEGPFLQGWAIVENTTEDDWKDVNLRLVSGRPISYRMDLYEPLYVERPLEQLNLYSSLRAQVYGQDLAGKDKAFEALAERRQKAARRDMPGQGGAMAKSESAMMGGRGPAAPMAAAAPALAAGEVDVDASGSQRIDFFAANGQNSAKAGQVGELFEYAIDTPVTIARQKSAMLPIVNENVKGEKVSIYNANVQAKHPLNGLKLTNSTKLHLMQGPITVFDGATYAGDAKIEDLAPGAERLISYALDLKTEVASESTGKPEQLVKVKLAKGVLEVNRKYARHTTYTVKNSDDKAKTVLIEYPHDPAWKLVTPKEPAEKTRDQYRFAVQAEPGKPAKLEIEEEQLVNQSLVLSNIDDGLITYFISQKEVSPEVKAALQEVIKRKTALQQLVQERSRLEQQIAEISQEQQRIRENMGQLDRNTDLYRRYVQKFGSQEDSVEKMREQIKKLSDEEVKQRQSLDAYLLSLNV